MADIQEYKCPCCGGGVEFNAGVQKMKCPYCDTEFELDALIQYDTETEPKEDSMEWESSDESWMAGETNGMKVYLCKSCGGEIIGDDTTGATSCPYCGNPVIVGGMFSGGLKPEVVIPFKLNRDQAKQAYMNHISGRKLLPRAFKDYNHIEEIKGVYVPFWLFDAKADATAVYEATKHQERRDSNFIYKETLYYSVSRSGQLNFEHVPVDGASKMDDTLMQSLEPYDYSQAMKFHAAYLAGYLADKYDVSKEECIEIANKRIKTSTKQYLDSTVGQYDSYTTKTSNVNLSDGTVRYALYPVYILNTEYEGQKYTFAMNGQTGKFVGDLPVDERSLKSRFWKILGIVGGACYALSWLLWLL